MDEPFELPVEFKGEELQFPAQLKQFGYKHRFVVAVFGQDVFFEPDEERNYRALIDPEQLEANKKLNVDLLQAIAVGIEAVIS